MLVYAGPFPETSQSNTHVLLVTDYFTKWVEAAPLQKKDPLSVAKALATIFYRWAPLLLVMLHLCSEMGRTGMCVAKILNVHKVVTHESRNFPVYRRDHAVPLSCFLQSTWEELVILLLSGEGRKRQKWFSE